MLAFPVSSVSHERLKEAWERFVRTETIDSAAIRPIISSSWLRCRRAGLDPWKVERISLGQDELRARVSRSRTMVDVARQFMGSLYKLVAGSGFVVCLCDQDGYLLEVMGDTEALSEGERIWLTPGVNWSESAMGTSGIGVSLATDSPVQVCAAEHYWIGCHSWTCSSAPIHDPRGELIGVLTMSGHCTKVHPHTLGMVVAAAQAIDNELEARRASEGLAVAHQYLLATMESITDGLLTVDIEGRVSHLNAVAGRLLGLDRTVTVGKKLGHSMFRQLGLGEVLQTGREFADRELDLDLPKGKSHLSATAKPVKSPDGRVMGATVILREMGTVRKLVQRMAGARAMFTFADIIGEDPAFRRAVDMAMVAAESSSTVLLLGESGTGKEMFAHAIHNASSRRDGPFVALNCAAIPRELVGTELFGYAEGAFTGARREGSPGKFELADGGTIFLDEIGEMPLDLQVALLRVLQDKQVTRVGGRRVVPVDVRVIASTNKSISEEVARGSFRRDLYFRLNVFPISIPPLRDRKSDIPILANHFMEKLATKMGKSVRGIDKDAMEVLLSHDWPGNVRELENLIEHVINVSKDGLIKASTILTALNNSPRSRGTPRPSGCGTSLTLESSEKLTLLEALRCSRGLVSEAAKILGVSRSTLYRKMKKHDITVGRVPCTPR